MKGFLVPRVDSLKPGPGQVLRTVEILKIIVSGGMQNFCVLDNFQVVLWYISYLRRWPVSGIHQDSKVWLRPPVRTPLVHLLNPRGGGTCCFIPTYDDTTVPPSFMLDNLSHPELDVGRPGIARLWALAKEAILVPILEDLDGRTLSQGVHVAQRVQQVLDPEGE